MVWREEFSSPAAVPEVTDDSSGAGDGRGEGCSWLVCYAGQQAACPLVVLQLQDGRVQVAPPPAARAGYPHCMQLSVAVSADPVDGEQVLVLATETGPDAAEWAELLTSGGRTIASLRVPSRAEAR